MRTKIAKWGNSAAVRLPRAALETAGFSPGQQVEVDARDGVVELRLKRRIPTIEELFAEAEKNGPLVPPPFVDWGPDVGAEVIGDDWSDIAPTDEEMGIPVADRRRTRPRRG
jgi:antitoxin MazE